MSDKASVTDGAQGSSYSTNVKLVSGIGRKSIRVIIRPAHGRRGYKDENQVAIDAAKLAASKGWCKIIVAPDDCEGCSIRGSNLLQYNCEQ